MSVRCHRGQRTFGELPPGAFPNQPYANLRGRRSIVRSGQLPIVHRYGYFVGVRWRICRLDPASRRGVLTLRLSAAWGREGNAADTFLVGTVAVALGSSLDIASSGCPVSECGAVSADPFGVAERDCATDGVGSCAGSRGAVAGAVDCGIAS